MKVSLGSLSRWSCLSALAALLLPACALKKNMADAEPTPFLKGSGAPTTGKMARLPFDHSWRDPGVAAASYSRVVIRPVSLAWLRKDQWHESASAQITSQEAYLGFARQVARHWDASLQSSFRAPQNHLQPVSDTTQPGTLIMEIAMTEIVFGHPGTYAASFAVPGGGLADSAMFSPTVAFEARVTDAATGKIVATAADRRGTKVKLVDLNRLSITRPNEEICDEWSTQMMQAFNQNMFPLVKRTRFSPF